MRILFVAYPLLPVSAQSAGGAEQVLHTIERECAGSGLRTVVAAAAGSQVAGELLETGAPMRDCDRLEERDREHNSTILRALSNGHSDIDVVHDNGGSFWQEAGRVNVPVLATLHLPRWFYPPEVFEEMPPNLFLNCVSRAQALWFQDLPNMLGSVANGIALERFPVCRTKQDYLLWLGRVCEEKGAHVALEVAERARMPLVMAGQVYPFSYHQQYFRHEVLPRIGAAGSRVRFVEQPTLEEKCELLRGARAVLIPSQVEETSSMVAMEAMACGTPVLALRRGALPEVVKDGVTGFISDSVEQMAEDVRRAGEIAPEACRSHVERNFTARRMAADYRRLYAGIARVGAEDVATAEAIAA